jgi:hypothetical protein
MPNTIDSTENAMTIWQLDPTQPPGGQAASFGDNHIRELKKSIKNSFTGWKGVAFALGDFDASSTATAYHVNIALSDDVTVNAADAFALCFLPTADCADNVTLTIRRNDTADYVPVSGLIDHFIYSTSGANLKAGSIKANIPVGVFWNGAKFTLISGNDKTTFDEIGTNYATKEYVNNAINDVVFDDVAPGAEGHDGEVVIASNGSYTLADIASLPSMIAAIEQVENFIFFTRK